jgi:ERCC4-related helicase
LVEQIKEYAEAPKRFKLDFSSGSKIKLLPTDDSATEAVKELKLTSPDDYHGMVFRMTKTYDQFRNYHLEDLNNFLNSCNELARLPNWGSRAAPPTFEEIGPKVQCLVDILLEYETSGSEFCGIVFCQQRIMARVLEVTLRSHPELKFIRTGCLLGHGRSSKSSGMSAKSQELIVGNFRTGTINLLIATQVAEEGLDIKPCNCVIRFNMKDMTLINYIQSRGRARHETSQFVIMSEKGDEAVAHLLQGIILIYCSSKIFGRDAKRNFKLRTNTSRV